MKPLMQVGIKYDTNFTLVRPKPFYPFSVKDHFCSDINFLRIFPGEFTSTKSLLQGVKGLVLQTFGAGNAPDDQPLFLEALREATERGVVIVNVTQCASGEVEAHYAAGTALVEAGVIPAGDMTPEAALVKLGWLLGNDDLSPAEVRALFVKDLRGEVTVREENDVLDFQNNGFAKAVYKVMIQSGSLSKKRQNDDQYKIVNEIQAAILPILVCQFSTSGNVDELATMFL